MNPEPDFRDIIASHAARQQQSHEQAAALVREEEQRRQANHRLVESVLREQVRPVFEKAFQQLQQAGHFAQIEGVRVEVGSDRAIALILTFSAHPEIASQPPQIYSQLGYRGFPATLAFKREGLLPAESLPLTAITAEKVAEDVREFLTRVFS